MTLDLEKVLIIEDERASREAMEDYLRRKKIPVISAVDGLQGLELLDSDVTVVVTDLKMPNMDGMGVLREVRARQPQTAVIMITAHGEITTAVEAMKLGAIDYLTKPVNPDELYLKIRRVHDTHVLHSQNSALRQQLEEKYGFEEIVGISPSMISVFERIQRVAVTNSTVLITGENGTGKELVARALHNHSLRNNGPFIAISSANIPGNLVESELFGHMKGAFTGATERSVGKFKAAEGGTLFIDEIGELALDTQAKLLRVLEDLMIVPVGGTKPEKIDTRLVFATNKHLEELVEKKEFRQDLFYRVKVISIHLPPLRERRDDIPLLAKHFAQEIATQNNKPVLEITSEALQRLREYQWPGNVRELRNCIESVGVLLEKNEIAAEDLPEDIRLPRTVAEHSRFPVGLSLRELEREAIEKTLRKVGGSRVKASEILGLSVRSIQRKISDYKLDV